MIAGPCGSAAVHTHAALPSVAAKARLLQAQRTSPWRQRLRARAVHLLSGLHRDAATLRVFVDFHSRMRGGVSSPRLKRALLKVVCCRPSRRHSAVLHHYPHRAQQADLEAGAVAFVAGLISRIPVGGQAPANEMGRTRAVMAFLENRITRCRREAVSDAPKPLFRALHGLGVPA